MFIEVKYSHFAVDDPNVDPVSVFPNLLGEASPILEPSTCSSWTVFLIFLTHPIISQLMTTMNRETRETCPTTSATETENVLHALYSFATSPTRLHHRTSTNSSQLMAKFRGFTTSSQREAWFSSHMYAHRWALAHSPSYPPKPRLSNLHRRAHQRYIPPISFILR